MAKEKFVQRQVHQYDKIIRENLEAMLPGLIKLLGIQVMQTEELPDDIQHTKERRPDVLKKITDEAGDAFVLHIEFQVKDEPEMVYRMAEYFIMLHRLYKIEVRQYVIYLGQGLSTMPTEFVQGKMNFRYELISLSCIDHRLLLSARDPKAKILAILGDFGSKPPQQVVNDIAKQVFESSEGDFAEKRHIKQLRVLMKLRNLDLENLHEMDSLAPYLTPERDFLYKIGERKGMEAGLEKGETKKATSLVKNLLRKTDFTVAQIAELVDVSQYFVRKVKRSITSRTR